MILLLFFLFVGCAVDCDESQTFVVQMSSNDPPTRHLQIYWNVPTKQCRSKKIHFDGLDQFGIVQNKDDRFRGEQITILYDPGYFPALLRNESSKELRFRNGGVPQEGDLDLHLKSFATDLRMSIPDSNFSGVGIIDFESWRPIFRQNYGEVLPYQSISIEIEKQWYWWLPERMIKEKARQRFEESARIFIQYTIALAQRLRPLAKWGYYGFPYCFNTVQNNMYEDCPRKVKAENDQINWLWSNSTALYPSVYSSSDMSTSQLIKRIRGRVREAARVRARGSSILPYFSFRYRDEGYFTETDLHTVLKTIATSEAAGLIIWGSSNDVNTVDKCKNLQNYIYNVFGPIVAKYTNFKKYHKQDNETINDHNDNRFTDNDIKENTLNTPSHELQIKDEDLLTTSNPLFGNETLIEIDLETTTSSTNTTYTSTEDENITEIIYNLFENNEFTTKDPIQDGANDDTTEDLKIKQVTSWAFIFGTILSVINHTADGLYNNTRFELALETSDHETSTYLEYDLLVNNFGDYTHAIMSETTENIATSTSIEITETNNSDDLETTTFVETPKHSTENEINISTYAPNKISNTSDSITIIEGHDDIQVKSTTEELSVSSTVIPIDSIVTDALSVIHEKRYYNDLETTTFIELHRYTPKNEANKIKGETTENIHNNDFSISIEANNDIDEESTTKNSILTYETSDTVSFTISDNESNTVVPKNDTVENIYKSRFHFKDKPHNNTDKLESFKSETTRGDKNKNIEDIPRTEKGQELLENTHHITNDMTKDRVSNMLSTIKNAIKSSKAETIDNDNVSKRRKALPLSFKDMFRGDNNFNKLESTTDTKLGNTVISAESLTSDATTQQVLNESYDLF